MTSASPLGIVLLLFTISSLSLYLEVNAKPKPAGTPKFTLDPETLAEVKQLLKVKDTPESPSPIQIGFRLGNNEPIIFEEQASPLQGHARQRQAVAAANPSSAASHKCVNPRDRFHVPSGKCYTPGTGGGPCGDNMLFYAQEGNKLYGECDCDYNAEIPLVFHAATGSCYPIYDQAYCKPNEWLVFDAKEYPVCEQRKCPPHSQKTTLYFKNRCVYWDEYNSICDYTYQKVIFMPDSLEPTCAEPSVSEQSNFNIPKLKCKPGSSQDIKGNCREKIKFNFNG